MAAWHTLDCRRVYEQWGSLPKGLDLKEAAHRLALYGLNELAERGLRSPWAVLLDQFTEIMVVAVLLIAAAISRFIGEMGDGIMITVIVVLHAILGFAHGYRAKRAIAALKELPVPTVRVCQSDQVHQLEATNLVPSDIFLVKASDRAPIDARVVDSVNLRAEEAALTGKSAPADKTKEPIVAEYIPLGERRNPLYMGAPVVYGRGTAVATETGIHTELGNIGDMLLRALLAMFIVNPWGVGRAATSLDKRPVHRQSRKENV